MSKTSAARSRSPPGPAESNRGITYRIATNAGLFRLDGDPEKRDRAREELLAAAAFADWNEGFDLGTAELTFAVALGYDWLYDVLTPE